MAVECHGLAGQYVATGGGCNVQEILATLANRTVAPVGRRPCQASEDKGQGQLDAAVSVGVL